MNIKNHANLISYIDLSLYYFGSQECERGHSFGPAVKEHFKIHYIHKGKGIFRIGDKTFSLKQGQGFVICPGTVVYYAADKEDPWTYSWVAFNGRSAPEYLKRSGVASEHPIFTYERDEAIAQCFEEMLAANTNLKSRDLRLQSLLCNFFAILIDNSEVKLIKDKSVSLKTGYVSRVIEFIQAHYSNKISISELAGHVYLSEKYLSAIFKEETGIPIQRYIVNYRLNKACDMMKDKRLSIGDISRSVGYEDPLLFSRMFKKLKGVSPRLYSKNL